MADSYRKILERAPAAGIKVTDRDYIRLDHMCELMETGLISVYNEGESTIVRDMLVAMANRIDARDSISLRLRIAAAIKSHHDPESLADSDEAGYSDE